MREGKCAVWVGQGLEHGHNLANNIWGGGNKPWVLGALIYEVVGLERGCKIGLNRSLYTHFPSFRPIFLFAPWQLDSHKKLFLGRNTTGGAFALPLPTNLCLWVSDKFIPVHARKVCKARSYSCTFLTLALLEGCGQLHTLASSSPET
jgi:hypothetical protein